MMQCLYVDSANLIRLTDLVDKLTGLPVTDAVVTGRVIGVEGAEADLEADDAGNYAGTIDGGLLVDGTVYTVEIVAVAGQTQLTIRQQVPAKYKG